MRNPNGYGSISKLSGKRRRPYIVRSAAEMIYNKDTGKTTWERKTIGYYETRKDAILALAEYNKDPYNIDARKLTFKDVYNMYYDAKYVHSKKKLSKSSEWATKAAFKHCSNLHNKIFSDIKTLDLQNVIDTCPLKHSSLEHIVNLFKQMYKFAGANDLTDKNYAQFVTINIQDDDEVGVPFSEKELKILWDNKNVPYVDTILILIYSGFRIAAWKDMEINLDKGFFKGGVKTKAGKNRVVPIHPAIYSMVSKYNGETWLQCSDDYYRKKCFYPTLKKLGIETSIENTKHTPHDTRHTFSWLCDKYNVNDTAKHMLMGHSVQGDVEQTIYAHRTLDELRKEIEKIQV